MAGMDLSHLEGLDLSDLNLDGLDLDDFDDADVSCAPKSLRHT